MRIGIHSLLVSCLIALFTPQASALTPAEMQDWSIVCAQTATESEAYAAQEFQTLFKGLTGTTLPIVNMQSSETDLEIADMTSPTSESKRS